MESTRKKAVGVVDKLGLHFPGPSERVVPPVADAFRLNAVVSYGTATVSALRLIDAQVSYRRPMGKVVSSAAALTGAVSNLADRLPWPGLLAL